MTDLGTPTPVNNLLTPLSLGGFAIYGTDPSDLTLSVQRIDILGNSGASVQVATATAGRTITDSDIVGLSDGGIGVWWVEHDAASNADHLLYRTVATDGSLGTEHVIAQPPAGTQNIAYDNVHAVLLDDGNVAFAADRVEEGGADSRVFTSTIAPNGTQSESRTVAGSAASQTFDDGAQLTALIGGGYAVLYQQGSNLQFGPDSEFGKVVSHVKLYDDSGAAGADTIVGTIYADGVVTPEYDGKFAALAGLPDGGFAVVATQANLADQSGNRSVNQDGGTNSVYSASGALVSQVSVDTAFEQPASQSGLSGSNYLPSGSFNLVDLPASADGYILYGHAGGTGAAIYAGYGSGGDGVVQPLILPPGSNIDTFEGESYGLYDGRVLLDVVGYAGQAIYDPRQQGVSWTGTDAAEQYYGTPYGDALDGGKGDDVIAGGAGNDTIDGGGGNDTLDGGSGDDLIRPGAIFKGPYAFPGGLLPPSPFTFGKLTIDGGPGTDTLDLSTAVADTTVDYHQGTPGKAYGALNVDLAKGLLSTGGSTTLDDNQSPIVSVQAGDGTIVNVENVNGNDGPNIILGDANANVIQGFGGNDLLSGGGGSDQIYGGSGDDIIERSDGDHEILAGGDGTDTLIDLDSSPYFANLGNTLDARNTDTISGFENVTGGSGNDILFGNDAANAIRGGGGDDTLYAVGPVADTLDGDAGNDTLYGATVALSDQADTPGGSFGVGGDYDVLNGEDGSDIIEGTIARIHAQGGSGNDTITGGSGRDLIEGGPGSDILDGGTGVDVLFGDVAFPIPIDQLTDEYPGRYAPGTDYITLPSGYDTSNYETGGTLREGLDELYSPSGEEGDDFSVGDDDFAYVFAGSGDDTVNVRGGSASVSGGKGEDIVTGSTSDPGEASVYGGPGNDLVQGGFDNLLVSGGTGDDLIKPSSINGIIDVDGDEGINTLDLSAFSKNISIDLSAHRTNTSKKESLDNLTIAQVEGEYLYEDPNLLIKGAGKGGNDVTGVIVLVENVTGGSGNDSITGGPEANVLQGGDGSDTLAGGGGADQLFGEAGNDRLVAGPDSEQISGGGGEDIVDYSGLTRPMTVDLSAGTASDELAKVDVLDTIEDVTGTAFNDTIKGDAGNNTINGGLGADTMMGGAGDDTYYVDDPGDRITDTSGTDRVYVDMSKFIDPTVNMNNYKGVENLLLTSLIGSPAEVVGDALDNVVDLRTVTGQVRIEGGAGTDTVRLPGKSADYGIVKFGQDVKVTSLLPNAGVDADLNDVEVVAFDDKSVTVTSDPNAGRSTTSSGVVEDGYLAGATVFADANGNGILDRDEASTTTDENGAFALTDASGTLFATGGMDVTTDLVFTGTLEAPVGSSVISPLTTLVVDLAAGGAADPMAEIDAALGLPVGFDITMSDPAALVAAGDATGQAALVAQAAVADTVALLAAGLVGAGDASAEAAYDRVMSAIAAMIAAGRPVTLTDAATVATIGTSAGLDAAAASAIATVAATENAALGDAGRTVAAIEAEAQGPLASAIVAAGDDPSALASLSATGPSGTAAMNSGTTVANTDPLVIAPPTNNSPGTPPTGMVSLDPAVSYSRGVFTLTGRASSPAGVAGVEISAVLDDGSRQDLGAATVNADGSFSFADRIGPNQQSFLVATLTDNAGVQTASGDQGFNLTGGLAGGAGRQNSFSPDTQVSTALFRPNGQRSVSVDAPGQTVELQPFDIVSNHRQANTTFVFSPGDGLGVIHGFKVGGAGHDTLSLSGADFHNSIAAVLRNTGDIQGSAFVTDPVTGDAIRLAGVTTAELKAHPRDFTFHM